MRTISNDKFLIAGFLRSRHWEDARETEAFKQRRFRDFIRAYLHDECGRPENTGEATEIEQTVGRVLSGIRSKWATKAAKTRARNKRRKQKELARRAEEVIARFVALKSPLLFGQTLPVVHAPVNPNKTKPRRKVA